jgi:4-hydroxybenzoate polyprenyltransferase
MSSTLQFPYLKALRPRQWTKNFVVFAAVLFSFELTAQAILGGIVAFVLFCCASSSFYLINDIMDVEDRKSVV